MKKKRIKKSDGKIEIQRMKANKWERIAISKRDKKKRKRNKKRDSENDGKKQRIKERKFLGLK